MPGIWRGGLAAAMCLTVVSPTLFASTRGRAATPTRWETRVGDAGATVTADAVAVQTREPVVLDGKLDESIWAQAPRINEFVQRDPAEGEAPSQKTEARVAYDDEALYVGVRAFDTEPGKVVGILTRRDQRSPSDWIRVVIDSYFDRRSAYEFGVNPAGVKTDRYYYNDGPQDDGWDAVWDVQTHKDAEGWSAEFKIPFSQLRFKSGQDGPVGFAVIREVGRLAETSSWPLLSRNANGFVSQFGELNGVRLGRTPRKLEMAPYSVAKVNAERVSAANPLTDSIAATSSLGLDMKYAVRPGLTFTGTVNPDFGQVEADPAVVNLDAFEIFFPERRPFFVEGSGTFRFNMDCNDGNCTGLFYSRRIGRTPQGSPDVGDNEFSKRPDAATIIGAGKLSGRVGRYSVGALTAVTAREEAEVASANGRDRRLETVEPLTAYSVLRARREYDNQSSLGFMTTVTNRQIVPSVSFLADNAAAGGVDYDWRLSKTYSLNGYWAGSFIEGTEAAITRLQENAVHGFQRPDADYVELDPAATSLRGHAGAVNFGKIAGEKTRFNSYAGFKSPGFDSNDLGYMRRADERTMSNWFQYRDFVPGKYVRNYVWNLNQWAGWNFGGERLYLGGNFNTHWTWTNYYSAGMGINAESSPLRDRVTRGGPAVLGEPSKSVWFYANTDSRKPLSFSYNGWFWADRSGSTQRNYNPWANVRPTSFISLNAGFRYSINKNDAQWIANQTDTAGVTHYVFGRIDQKTAAVTLRFDYTMTPNLSLQVYAEPFVSAGDYTDFKQLVDGRAPRYADRYAPYAYTGSADFNYRSFRTTNVLRWEYKPGSMLFVVWQQGRQDSLGYGDFRFGRDFGGIFAAPGRNVFLVKFSYWVNM
jgi:hypothetical protein